jgi:hypothetical protein
MKTHQHNGKPLGLNAVGKPYGANYDPNYRMNHKPSYGHLRSPYRPGMKFVGEPPIADNPRLHVRRPRPAPLFDNRVDDQAMERMRAAVVTKVIAAASRALCKPAMRDAIIAVLRDELEKVEPAVAALSHQRRTS